MLVIKVRAGIVTEVVETHQEVDYAPGENPQPEQLSRDIDYTVDSDNTEQE